MTDYVFLILILVFQVLVSPFYTPHQVADVMESTMHTQV